MVHTLPLEVILLLSVFPSGIYSTIWKVDVDFLLPFWSDKAIA